MDHTFQLRRGPGTPYGSLVDKFHARLHRSTITTASRWAEQYRVMAEPFPGPWTFKFHPWLREFHDSDAEQNVVQKSAQAGFTEAMLNIVCFQIDVHKRSTLYLLPNLRPDAMDFSATRFDKAVELSPHLQSIFSKNQNAGLKRAGAAEVLIRGTGSKSGLKSNPVSILCLDEFDEMVEENVALAEERLSGQRWKRTYRTSTPTLPGRGVNLYFEESTKELYFFPCPHCGKWINLEIEDFVLVPEALEQSHCRCRECKHPLSHEGKLDYLACGKWIPQNRKAQFNMRGFRVNQLYSYTVRPHEFARTVLLAQTDPRYEQELYNSKLGLPRVTRGAKIEDDQILGCKTANGSFHSLSKATNDGRIRTLGIDVGTFLHWVVYEWDTTTLSPDINTASRPRLIAFGKVPDFKDLDELMHRFQINGAIIDMNPERRKAKEFADRFRGYVRLAFYGNGVSSRTIMEKTDNDSHVVEDYQITVDRTTWLDVALSRVRTKGMDLPGDLDSEFVTHLKNVIKVYGKDRNGNPTTRYQTDQDKLGDHYVHAMAYAEIALPLAASIQSGNADMTSFAL